MNYRPPSPPRPSLASRRPAAAFVSLLALVALLAFGAASASAVAPTVTTEAATLIGKTSATLNGTVNPNGVLTNYYFEYGTTVAYGTKTAETSLGTLKVGVKVSKLIASLTENTKYHFRVVATSKDGTSFGEDKTFEYIPSWSLQTTPNPSGATVAHLNDASCLTGGECFAVGDYETSGFPARPAAERWNGSAWSLQTIPALPSTGGLEGVSCTSTTACTAVGWFTTSSVRQVLAERWNGTAWSKQEAPGDITSEFHGVSCVSSTECIAVGKHNGSNDSFAERWNGTEWKIQTTPNPASGGAGNVLQDVSCTSSSFCMAVGFSAEGVMTFTWNGTSWTNQTPFAGFVAEGVSCTASTACTSVGWALGPGGIGNPVPVAARWNGTAWSVQTTAVPAEAKKTKLQDVSCSSSTVCVATGFSENSPGVTTTLTERWNGTSWEIRSSPNPAGATFSTLLGVSCIATGVCESVGSSTAEGKTLTLAERAS